MSKKDNLSKFEKRIGLKFKNKKLLGQVFVHRSYINEHPDFELDHNERLEFLGDAVLELIATEYLYRHYDRPEGELTNWRSALVKGPMLSKIAHQLGMNDLMYLSRGEERSAGKARDLILANAFEALIGAIYLDQGYKKTQKFIEKHLLVHLEEILAKELYLDAKSHLQEIIQEQEKITPRYEVLSESGPDHAKQFTIGVYINNEMIGKGFGASKQAAEQSAAEDALKKWEE